ncbi:MAG: transglycosylase SLT domain-containing protein [Bdellovibrionales bacterium]
MASNNVRRTLNLIEKAIELFPKIVAKKKRAFKHKQAILKNFAPLSRELARQEFERVARTPHPWRACPVGEHWVSTHPVHVPVSAKNPTGLTIRDGHCRTNPSKKDQLYADEIMKIAMEHFHKAKKIPTPNALGSKYGNDFDKLIAGWTQYWNEIMDLRTPLDPNLVKALISTESDFNISAKALASKGNWARGLMQITDKTLEILKDEKGELKNFLVNVDQGDAHDPNLNISAGIRWLFHKKALLEKRKKRAVSWEEAVMDYKGYTKDLKIKNKSATTQSHFYF